MKFRNQVTLLSLSLMISLPAITWAQAGRDKDRASIEKTEAAELHDDVAEMRGHDEDLVDAMQDEHDEKESGAKKPKIKGDKEARSKGNERSREMRARRDERKAIRDDYKSDRKPGQEAVSGMKSDQDSDSYDEFADNQEVADSDDVSGKGEVAREKSKKSWWKFWGE